MKYQPHVDRLRTLVVMPVVIFHLGSPFVSGSYVGIEIFFVISAYLIATLPFEDIARGRCSLLDFHKRGILRILPPLAGGETAEARLSGACLEASRSRIPARSSGAVCERPAARRKGGTA